MIYVNEFFLEGIFIIVDCLYQICVGIKEEIVELIGIDYFWEFFFDSIGGWSRQSSFFGDGLIQINIQGELVDVF